MALRDRMLRLAKATHLPRRTVRLRLTLLYGMLFLLSGAALLTTTYFLVDAATGNAFIVHGQDGLTFAGYQIGTNPPGNKSGGLNLFSPSRSTESRPVGAHGSGGSFSHDRVVQTKGKTSTSGGLVSAGGASTGAKPTPTDVKKQQEQMADIQRQLETLAHAYQGSELHQLLIESGVALGIMVLLSGGLGWVVAGRVLRPLRTITASTRDISASNLNERLAVDGPDDELKELGDTIDGLLERLEASFHSQRQFVANASHELRTPLARQRTLAQVALADPEASAESLRAAARTDSRLGGATGTADRCPAHPLEVAGRHGGPSEDRPGCHRGRAARGAPAGGSGPRAARGCESRSRPPCTVTPASSSAWWPTWSTTQCGTTWPVARSRYGPGRGTTVPG